MTADSFSWVEADVAAEIVHTLYAYENEGKIVLMAILNHYQANTVKGIIANIGPFQMSRLVIDLEKHTVNIKSLNGPETEFPRIRDDRVGLRCRYGFSASLRPPGEDLDFDGILKWDLEEGRLVRQIIFPEGVVGGEPVFLPRTGSSPDEAGDNGYIGTFLWNTRTFESTFAIYDARSLSSTPVTEFSVPRRVPVGFHATWITEEQFQQQLSTP